MAYTPNGNVKAQKQILKLFEIRKITLLKDSTNQNVQWSMRKSATIIPIQRMASAVARRVSCGSSRIVYLPPIIFREVPIL